MFATFNPHTRSQDPAKYTFKKPVSSTDILTLKTNIEATYNVAFVYSGNEYDYSVTLTGASGEFKRAMNTLFPPGRSDIIIQRSHF